MMRDAPGSNHAQPLISVVIPVYNASAFIRQAVDSALTQSYNHVEVIVVDDGSTENMDWLSREYGGQITYVRQPNGGPAKARNLGIQLAKGTYIAFLDADDVWEPDKLMVQLCVLQRSPETGLVYSRVAKMDEAGRPMTNSNNAKRQYAGRIFETLFMGNFIPTSTVMVRKDCFLAVGLFDESREMISVEDYDMWLRVVERYDVRYIDRPLSRYRKHGGSLSEAADRSYTCERKMIEKTIQGYEARYPVLGKLRGKRLAKLFYEYGYDVFAGGNFRHARVQFTKSLSYRVCNIRVGLYLLASYVPACVRAVRWIRRQRRGRARGVIPGAQRPKPMDTREA